MAKKGLELKLQVVSFIFIPYSEKKYFELSILQLGLSYVRTSTA
jgi:hypothetical protein